MSLEDLARELSQARGLKFRATSSGFSLELCRQEARFIRCLYITLGEPCAVHRVTRQAVMENIHFRQPMLDGPRGTGPIPKTPERRELVGHYTRAELEAGLLRELMAKEFPSEVPPPQE